MMRARNIQKMLASVMFTVGLGLFLFSAQASHLILKKGHEVSVGEKKVVKEHHMPTFQKEGAGAWLHKSPLKRVRSRSAGDLFYAAIDINYIHPPEISLPETRADGISSVSLLKPTLRGPPHC